MKVWYLLFLAAPTVACSDVVAPVTTNALTPSHIAPAVLINTKTPYESAITACNGETVVVSGKEHDVVKVDTNKDGDTKVSVTSSAHFSGIGTVTGAKYEGSVKYVDKEASSTKKFTYLNSTTIKLVGQGKVPDTYLEVKTEFVIDADGNVKRNESTFTSTCK